MSEKITITCQIYLFVYIFNRSVQMRLYTMHKGQHLLIFIMFLCLFFIAVLMGLAGPSMTLRFNIQASKVKTPGSNKTSGMQIHTPPKSEKIATNLI